MSHRIIYRRIGNRGIVLSTLAVIWLVTASGLLNGPRNEYNLMDEQLPVWVRAALWGVPGVAALVITWWRRFDELAWTLLIVAPAVRLFSFGVAWVTGEYPAGWRGMCVYAALVLLVNRCGAGLDKPMPLLTRGPMWQTRR